VHHAYQILKNQGYPAEQIILMSYDDIANNRSNPFPGQIFNKPNGDNVYFADDIDYRGDSVNKDVFQAVLKGDKATAGGPVLESDSNSRVFIYFADHGGVDLICMPTGSYLYADELNDTLQFMHDNNMYKELVFYMEACESGSMFPDLTSKEGIYAMTATNATTSSWGTYCGTSAVVQGKNLGTCLGDLFSVNWMEDTEANNPQTETLQTQHDNVVATTTKSPVQKFGDFDFMSEPIGDFEGILTPNSKSTFGSQLKKYAHEFKSKIMGPSMENHHIKELSSVNSRDIALHSLSHNAQMDWSHESKELLTQEIENRAWWDTLFVTHFDEHLEGMNADVTVKDHEKYRFLVESVETLCGRLTDYSLKYTRQIAMASENLSDDQIATIMGKLANHCTQ